MPLKEEEKTLEKKESFKQSLSEEDQKKYFEMMETSKNLKKNSKSPEEFNLMLDSYLDEWIELMIPTVSPLCMMECPIGVTYFQKFLTTEMNTENLQAYLDFRTFTEEMEPTNRETPPFSKVVEDLDKIVSSYLADGSPQEINIPSKVKKSWLEHHKLAKKISKENEIKEWKEKIKTDLYDSVQSELMINISDPFSRFVYDPLFREVARFIFSGKVEDMRDKIAQAGKNGTIVLNNIIEWDKNIQTLNPLTISIELLQELKQIISEKEAWKEDGTMNYDAIVSQTNFTWPRFLQKICKLQVVDLTVLSDDEKKAFFINVYNLLYLHGSLEFAGDVNTLLERTLLLKNLQYNIGGQLYSLDSLINNIFKSKDECQLCSLFKKKLNIKEKSNTQSSLPKDETMFFSLIDLTMSSPDLHVMDAKNLKEQLKENTKKFIKEFVHVDHDEKLIIIPHLFTDFYKEFKQDKLSSDESIKKFLSAYTEIPLNYVIKKTDPNYQLDLAATGLTKRKNLLKDKMIQAKKQGSLAGITESSSRVHYENWSRAINNSPVKKSSTVYLKAYNNTFISSELITWLEENKEAKVDRNQAAGFLNLLFLQKVLIVLSGPTTGIADDSRQIIQIQKNIIPLAFGKTLMSGRLQKKKRFQIIPKKYHVVLYDSGFGLFDGARLVDAWLFLPTMKFQATIMADEVSFDISILPYAQMTFSTKSNEERSLWVKELSKLDQYVNLKEEKVTIHSSNWFKKHFF